MHPTTQRNVHKRGLLWSVPKELWCFKQARKWRLRNKTTIPKTELNPRSNPKGTSGQHHSLVLVLVVLFFIVLPWTISFSFPGKQLFCFRVIPQILFSNLENHKVKNNLDLIVKPYLLMYQLVITTKHFNCFVISQKINEHIWNLKF